ncbi:MAG TPA: peptidase M23, partial [Kurthia gibsonii]|nr:peptidase M23 [Kurthia gibsonii]HZG10930.1 peptidase M23 [Kurthia gibsonii]
QKASNASSYQGSSSSAKSWIAQKESSNSYEARSATGKYIGKYQLDKSYLNGDYSAANQERVADNYVKQRYGSWEKAKQFWVSNGWY